MLITFKIVCFDGKVVRIPSVVLKYVWLFHLKTTSCLHMVSRRAIFCCFPFFFPQEKQLEALSEELRLYNHCPLSASALFRLCFLLVLELTASQCMKGL